MSLKHYSKECNLSFECKIMLLLFAKFLIVLVMLEHLYIFYIEMFSREKMGKRVFKNTLPEALFAQTKGLAANQGLYNGFLAAGLLRGLLTPNAEFSFQICLFFLSCVSVAGIYGAIRSSRDIFFKQALPALIAILTLLLATFG